MKCSYMVAVALTAASGLATAADFNATLAGFAGTGGVVVNGNSTPGAGHITMQYDAVGYAGAAAGQFAGGPNSTFATFCIELDQGAPGGAHGYDVVSLADAPNPPGGVSNPNAPASYGLTIAGRIHEVVASAINAGWINDDLSLGSASNIQLAAIQALIWDAIYGPGVVTAGGSVTSAMNELLTTHWVDGGRVSGLRAMVSSTGQDMLFVVPLPPAAFAGLATLVGVAGVARLRRR